MTKTHLTEAELRKRVIAAIRQQPGCEGVAEIGLEEVKVVGGESTWRASIIDNGTAKFDAAYHAATRVTEELSKSLELAR